MEGELKDKRWRIEETKQNKKQKTATTTKKKEKKAI